MRRRLGCPVCLQRGASPPFHSRKLTASFFPNSKINRRAAEFAELLNPLLSPPPFKDPSSSVPLWLGQCIAVHHRGKEIRRISDSSSPIQNWLSFPSPALAPLIPPPRPGKKTSKSFYTFASDLHPMLLFAHVGLALATARLYSRLDLLFLALGSILPDIIDKPLGLLVFGTPNMGRTFAHTLLFLLILGAISLRLRDIRLASLTWGVLVHLILDSMWSSPVILLWPLLGGFPPAPYLDTLSYLQILLSGLEEPEILIPELLGLGYILVLVYLKRGLIWAEIKRLLRRQGKGTGTGSA